MKYIKNYATEQQFLSDSANTGPYDYYYLWEKYDEYDGYAIGYYECGEDPESELVSGSSENYVMGEIFPGVAYISSEHAVAYNPIPLHLDFDTSANWQRPWSDFGLTHEIYSKYVSMVKSRAPMRMYNIVLNGSVLPTSVYYENYTDPDPIYGGIHDNFSINRMIIIDAVTETVTRPGIS